jgi:xanthine dehydrogenase accessory factor
MDLFKEIAELKKNNIKAALAIVINTRGSTPGKISSIMLICADGTTIGTIGGGKVEKDVIDKSKFVISSGVPQIYENTLDESYNYMCGGYISVYIEPIKPTQKVVIFGAGHVGQALTKILKLLDFYIIIVDDREEFGNRKNFPEADEIIVDEFIKTIDKLVIEEDTFIVIVTRGHEWDLEITKRIIKTPA